MKCVSGDFVCKLSSFCTAWDVYTITLQRVLRDILTMIPKLYKWLIAISLFMSVWYGVVFGHINIDLPKKCHQVVEVMPLYLLISFACYSLAVVGYRVATFNDCVDASEELKRQIKEAKADLTRKGFKYADEWK